MAGGTGVVPVSAEDDAMLFGGLGIEGKKPSPLGSTVPLVGNVGDPAKEEEFDLVNLSVSGGIMCDDFSTPYGALLDVTFGIKTTKIEGIDVNGIKYYNVLFVIEGNWDIFVALASDVKIPEDLDSFFALNLSSEGSQFSLEIGEGSQVM